MNKSASTCRLIDQYAISIPKDSGLLPCLYIPIAARDTNAIETYVGRIVMQLIPSSLGKALLVEAHEPEKADGRLAIWDVPESVVLHYKRQVWVHVDYRAYRRAYTRAFPDFDLTGLVLDHVMNRRIARLKNFMYLRVVPISRKPDEQWEPGNLMICLLVVVFSRCAADKHFMNVAHALQRAVDFIESSPMAWT